MYCAFWYVLEGNTPGKWVALSFGCDMGGEVVEGKGCVGILSWQLVDFVLVWSTI